MTPLRVAVVGCGHIAKSYAQTLAPHDEVAIVGATDLDLDRADAFVGEWGGRRYASFAAILEDPEVDLVLNLTTQDAHTDVIRAALNAGKHVYSEKPLALSYHEAAELVALAHERGTRLACAPMTFLGEAQQTAWKVLRAGELGTLKVAYAEANWGRLEDWHPDPTAFYQAGALFDVAPYAVTYLTTVLGPATSAVAVAKVALPDRTRLDGSSFTIDSPDFAVGMIEFASGVVARLTANFYVHKLNSKQRGLEFHGDSGSLYLGSWQEFDAGVEVAGYGEEYRAVPFVREPYRGTEWGRGIVEMAQAIEQGRPHRVTGEHAAHVTEILWALTESSRTRREVPIQSTFTPPEPMEWAL
jgi:predicted dehydrogenase